MSPDVPQAAKQAIDNCITTAIEWSPPHETCRAYAFLSNIIKEMRSQTYYKSDLAQNGAAKSKMSNQQNLLSLHASSWRSLCENALVRAAPRVVSIQAFKELSPDLQKRLRELGCIRYGPQISDYTSGQDRKYRSTYTNQFIDLNKPATSQSLDAEHVRSSIAHCKTKPAIPQMGVTEKTGSTNELRDIKKPPKGNFPQVRTTKAQEERAKFNQTKSIPSQRREVKEKVPVRKNFFENIKPRYLEPRPCKETLQKPSVKKLLSSSESSRNSSPVLGRNLRTKRTKGKTHAMSQDSLATTSRPRSAEPSTDSLTESQTSNKYGTYTKIKHTSKGSVESIQSIKCQSRPQTSGQSNKSKTKIPVFLNQCPKANNLENKDQEDEHKRHNVVNRTNVLTKLKPNRKQPGSLMNATKSSSAKVVPKIVKMPQAAKMPSKPSKHAKYPNKPEDKDKEIDVPAVKRSGTFLKDEPMFVDKSTDIDASKTDKISKVLGK